MKRISARGLEFETELFAVVRGEWDPGESRSRDCPGTAPHFVVKEVLVDSLDIIDDLPESTVTALAEEGGREYAAVWLAHDPRG